MYMEDITMYSPWAGDFPSTSRHAQMAYSLKAGNSRRLNPFMHEFLLLKEKNLLLLF